MSSSAIHPSGGQNRRPVPVRSPGQSVFDRGFGALLDAVAPCPWTAHTGDHRLTRRSLRAVRPSRPLYSAEERQRRDSTIWTLVQGVLAPVQFIAFGISLVLVLNYLWTGEGAAAATLSVLIKTALLYTIMVTGAVWEKVVFGRFLFAPSFFWEDVFSMLVLALHTAYLGMVLLNIGTPREQLILALAAYATYVVNAAQFIWKLRMARLQAPSRLETVQA
ncbi:2-vinyl bacteriochlorophyllide hydratase [Brevundimonas aurifodinae]|uniref:2-vinyl bacteriochlorophyllide hydratase n=2 Tax=Brevundimonas TaxID=41275 RepID=A0ABV1NPE8_9CAUL|nr:MAG: 2-vinyl bacteriochlorophyllide hydratase [Brevundimonas sp. 12-68-7]OYX35926.1 MAG: 2-vinyl bacteriochlorophyllide hydratase [Brevundimonas subvibrioides]